MNVSFYVFFGKLCTTNFAMNKELIMNPNQLVAFLEKPCAEFTKEDIKRYIHSKIGCFLFVIWLTDRKSVV